MMIPDRDTFDARETAEMIHPYDPPPDVNPRPTRRRISWRISDRIALTIALGVVASVYFAFVDWTQILR